MSTPSRLDECMERWVQTHLAQSPDFNPERLARLRGILAEPAQQ